MLLLASLLSLSGCETYMSWLEANPVAEGAFFVSGGLSGAAATIGCAPVMLPLSLLTDNGLELDFFLPGIAVGALVGGVTSFPLLITEALLRAPFRLRARAPTYAARTCPDCGQVDDDCKWTGCAGRVAVEPEFLSRCPYCDAEEGAPGCDWGKSCAEPASPPDPGDWLEWPPALLGPPERP